MLGKLYTPASFVIVVVTTPVWVFARVISVPGIRACCGSITVPDNTALVPCPYNSRTTADTRTKKVNTTRVRLIRFPPLIATQRPALHPARQRLHMFFVLKRLLLE